MVMDAGLDNTGHDGEGWDAKDRETAGHHGAGQEGGGCSDADRSSDTAASEMPDPRKLAQDWITLWQSELSAMAADPEIRESWQSVLAIWAGTMSAMLRSVSRDPRHDSSRRRSGPADAPRSPSTAAAPDARDAEIDRLARHVAALESRLAELERSGNPPVDPRRRPKRGPGRKPRG